jgi:hypothetical protein
MFKSLVTILVRAFDRLLCTVFPILDLQLKVFFELLELQAGLYGSRLSPVTYVV